MFYKIDEYSFGGIVAVCFEKKADALKKLKKDYEEHGMYCNGMYVMKGYKDDHGEFKGLFVKGYRSPNVDLLFDYLLSDDDIVKLAQGYCDGRLK